MRPILCLALALSLALAACGGSSPDTSAPADTAAPVVEAPANTEAPAATEAPTVDPNAAHAVGDVVDIGNGATLTLESAERNAKGELVIIATIDNTAGSEELAVSSMLNFEAKSPAGDKGTVAILYGDTDPGTATLNGAVPPGDKLRGYVAWDAKLGAPAKVYYIANLFGGERITFAVE